MIKGRIYCMDFGDERVLFLLNKQDKKEKEISSIAMLLAGPFACQRYFKDSDVHTQTLKNSYFKQHKNCIKKVDLKDLPLYVGWGWLSDFFTELIKAGLQ